MKGLLLTFALALELLGPGCLFAGECSPHTFPETSVEWTQRGLYDELPTSGSKSGFYFQEYDGERIAERDLQSERWVLEATEDDHARFRVEIRERFLTDTELWDRLNTTAAALEVTLSIAVSEFRSERAGTPCGT